MMKESRSEAIKTTAYKISMSSVVVSTFFIILLILQIIGVNIYYSILLALILSLLTFIATKISLRTHLKL